jgi:hypothetical protein
MKIGALASDADAPILFLGKNQAILPLYIP